MRDPAIVVQARVIGALILRDVKTRFGGNPFNYLLAIGWPLGHIAILLIIYTLAGRVAPYGSSALQFFATGVLPFLIFNYPARFVMLSVAFNAPLLGFPIVTLLDLILARIILEIVSACAVIMIVAATLYCLGVDVMPVDRVQAVAALCATLLLATGVGVLNSLIAKKFVAWQLAFVVFMIALYMASGIIFLPDSLPDWIRDILAWNPLLQAVTWFRSAYYEGYGSLHLDRRYLVIFGLMTLVMGFVLERLSRRWLLSS